MKCPHCGKFEDRVLESRSLAEGTSIRRRRECVSCGYRFTSYERVEEKQLMVVKTTGRREPFSREKIERGIQRALEKRNIGQDQIESIVNEIEDEAGLATKHSNEISSRALGEMVLEKLYALDDVAYVRFASVYRNFDNLEGFVQEIQRLSKNQSKKKPPRRVDSGEGT